MTRLPWRALDGLTVPGPKPGLIKRAAQGEPGAVEAVREYVVDRLHAAGLPPARWEALAGDVLKWLKSEAFVGHNARIPRDALCSGLLRQLWLSATPPCPGEASELKPASGRQRLGEQGTDACDRSTQCHRPSSGRHSRPCLGTWTRA